MKTRVSLKYFVTDCRNQILTYIKNFDVLNQNCQQILIEIFKFEIKLKILIFCAKFAQKSVFPV